MASDYEISDEEYYDSDEDMADGTQDDGEWITAQHLYA
jgi:hypothetical protein